MEKNFFKDLTVVAKCNYQVSLLFMLVISLSSPIFSGAVFAEDSISHWRNDPLKLGVKFQRQTSSFSTVGNASAWGSEGSKSNNVANVTDSGQSTKYSLDSNLLRQYDATFFYPFQSGKFNFDLGLNIKFISGFRETENSSGAVSSQSYNATLPMMYATALYELPWKGMSAGIEGKHLVFDNSTAYDYKAMLTYKSNSGFGLNGGWQYQLLDLNTFQNGTAESQTEGPFVDIFYKF